MNSYIFGFQFCLFLLLGFSIQGFWQSNSELTIHKTEDFQLNGEGTADHWDNTEWLEIPQRDVKSDSGEFSTKVKILYSETGLYFLFDCEDQQLSATMDADFMKLWKEDVVEVFLWPDEKFPIYFEYELSPLNYELPLLISNEQGDLARWQPFMYEEDRHTRHHTAVFGGKKKSGASINKWRAEFFIPYKLLRPLTNIPPQSGTQWKANFYRVDYDNEGRKYSWQEVTGSFHQIENFGTIIFQ